MTGAYDIYLDWLDETVGLLQRYRSESTTAPCQHTLADLADELRAIAGKVETEAQHLRKIADAVQHIEHQLGDKPAPKAATKATAPPQTFSKEDFEAAKRARERERTRQRHLFENEGAA